MIADWAGTTTAAAAACSYGSRDSSLASCTGPAASTAIFTATIAGFDFLGIVVETETTGLATVDLYQSHILLCRPFL